MAGRSESLASHLHLMQPDVWLLICLNYWLMLLFFILFPHIHRLPKISFICLFLPFRSDVYLRI